MALRDVLGNNKLTNIEILRHLNVEDIINLCKTNPDFRDICSDTQVWIDLIAKDFNMDVRQIYLEMKMKRDYFKGKPFDPEHDRYRLVPYIPGTVWFRSYYKYGTRENYIGNVLISDLISQIMRSMEVDSMSRLTIIKGGKEIEILGDPNPVLSYNKVYIQSTPEALKALGLQ